MRLIEINKDHKRYIQEILHIEEATFGKDGGVDMWLLKPLIKYGKVLAILGVDGSIEGVAEFIRDFEGREAYIYGFAIRGSERGKGKGIEFLRLIQNYMVDKKVEGLVLTVDENNIGAVKLYQKAGFEIVDRLKDEYGKGIDRLLMKLDMTKARA